MSKYLIRLLSITQATYPYLTTVKKCYNVIVFMVVVVSPADGVIELWQ
jgi:hypothetical protein